MVQRAHDPAVWVRNGGPGGSTATASVSRVDRDSTAVTRTVKLPAPPGGAGMSFSAGYPAMAVGAGGVRASTPDGRVARIEPETGRIVATVDAEATTLAAGREGVWVVAFDNAVTRIDPRTNRVAETIEIGSNRLSGVAVGAGSVWVTSEEGLLWRIEPGGRVPIMRSIDVGTGIACVAFGDGAVWTANWVKGTVSRIDPRTNAVTATVLVGATQALAAAMLGRSGPWRATAQEVNGMHAAAAAEVVLDAIARSDGTRASVLEQLRATEMEDGIIGTFRFDRHGDMTPARISIVRIRTEARPRDTLPGYRGAVLDRVVTVPTG